MKRTNACLVALLLYSLATARSTDAPATIYDLTGRTDELRQYWLDDVPVYVGKSPLGPVVVNGEPLMIQPQQVQDRCAEIVN